MLLPDDVTEFIRLTVFIDAVKTEVLDHGRTVPIGWFRDEVSAIGAALEHQIMRSAILPELRRIPTVRVTAEYRNQKCGKPAQRFTRGTAAKIGELGRKIVLLPNGNRKGWLSGNWAE